MKSDLEIARAAVLQPIGDIAASVGLKEDDLELYGRFKAKIHLDAVSADATRRSQARYVVVTAMTPTKAGEGKTVTTIGLSQAFATLGQPTVATIRQPSQGPTFGIKGGAAGGGYAQVVPMDDLNLHLTGDIHAVAAAHNLLAAAVDARMYHEGRLSDKRLARAGLHRLDIDPATVTFKRVVDVNDRALRRIGLCQDEADGPERDSGVDITAASEVMAILALATDRQDLRSRLGRIVVACNRDNRPVTAEDLAVAGAMAALLNDAIEPTMLQTLAGSPVLVHAGPFANIAHGNSSIVADKIALGMLADGGYLVTEAGFGSDCGFEKFSHIKCRASGLRPDCAVVVATVKALKEHGGLKRTKRGVPPPTPDEQAACLEGGLENLVGHIEIVGRFGVPAVVCVNRFPTDTDEEIESVIAAAQAAGARAAAPSEVWAHGGKGGVEIAEAVMAACDDGDGREGFRFLYDTETPLIDKMHTIATQIYGADGVDISDVAQQQIDRFSHLGFGHLPVIMAKTPASLSHDPTLKGRPRGFTVPVREMRLSAGAGFLYALCGDIMTMPGLPIRPAFMNIDVDAGGQVTGLS
ncbi:MAG TPA: formate--tetrahydrofolate ligase [Candidatus Latescibacteria bacterium]|jgi:formyltetrahydrofolate synthetase|nr:formate--tetrahydrofolate ligase [Gemmatimonadaceae bacterium]MDP6016150.1 formate--tetrahydrofolate ligase [Candidatus Latescibacterota bacterium]HJP30044.1 formate--tetrahydrofolate ligase [Candidatus Latescibacterota bacterium]